MIKCDLSQEGKVSWHENQFAIPRTISLPASSVHGILQATILEWVAIPFSRGSSLPMDQTWVSWIASGFFTIWATREAHNIIHIIKRINGLKAGGEGGNRG